MAALALRSLRGWTPVRVGVSEPLVEWAIVGRPFLEPFFEQTADAAMRHPFNAVFARTTPLEVLDALAAEPGPAPAGLIFHMSRCGSTLVTQMIARLASATALSEPQPFDALLRLRGQGSDDADETFVRRLRGLVRAFTEADDEHGSGERARRLVVKLHAWHVVALPLFVRAFPGVPWVFLFREPRGVLRSQERIPGAELVPGTIDPALLGVGDRAELAAPDYGARVLAAFCEAALRFEHAGRGMFLDYAALPEALFTTIVPFFGLRASDAELTELHAVARRDAKRGGQDFSPLAPGDRFAEEEIDRRASGRLDDAYAALAARSAPAAETRR